MPACLAILAAEIIAEAPEESSRIPGPRRRVPSRTTVKSASMEATVSM